MRCTKDNMNNQKCHAFNNGHCMNGFLCRPEEYKMVKSFEINNQNEDLRKEKNGSYINKEVQKNFNNFIDGYKSALFDIKINEQ